MEKNKVIFLDDENNIVNENNASKAIASEYDEDGTLIKETFFSFPEKRNFENDSIELNQESIDFIKKFNLSANLDNLDIKKKI